MSALGQYPHAPAGDRRGLSGSSPAARVWELPEGCALVLCEMSADLTADEWGQRLDVPASEVRAWCAVHRLPLRGDPRCAVAELSRRVDGERRRLGLTVRAVARATGIDAHTIASLKRRRYLKTETTAALIGWLRRVEVS